MQARLKFVNQTARKEALSFTGSIVRSRLETSLGRSEGSLGTVRLNWLGACADINATYIVGSEGSLGQKALGNQKEN